MPTLTYQQRLSLQKATQRARNNATKNEFNRKLKHVAKRMKKFSLIWKKENNLQKKPAKKQGGGTRKKNLQKTCKKTGRRHSQK
jgi:hypothetical protein